MLRGRCKNYTLFYFSASTVHFFAHICLYSTCRTNMTPQSQPWKRVQKCGDNYAGRSCWCVDALEVPNVHLPNAQQFSVPVFDWGHLNNTSVQTLWNLWCKLNNWNLELENESEQLKNTQCDQVTPSGRKWTIRCEHDLIFFLAPLKSHWVSLILSTE